MPTIQIRDLPELTYEVIRQRAQAAGRSIQSYMHEEIVRLANEPTDAELFGQTERFVAEQGVELDPEQLGRDVDADRR